LIVGLVKLILVTSHIECDSFEGTDQQAIMYVSWKS